MPEETNCRFAAGQEGLLANPAGPVCLHLAKASGIWQLFLRSTLCSNMLHAGRTNYVCSCRWIVTS